MDELERPDVWAARTDWSERPASPSADPRDERVEALLVVLAPGSSAGLADLQAHLSSRGVSASHHDVGTGVLMLPSTVADDVLRTLQGHPAVDRIIAPRTRYRLVRRDVHPSGTVVEVGGVPFGPGTFTVVAGPCAVESREQVLSLARAAAAGGAAALRGGSFKPRTSPYDFQGLGMAGVELLVEAREATGLPFVTEVMDTRQVEAMAELVDAFQVGARNMQNFDLLKALAATDRPVVLKRNPGATVEEWLLSAEYLLAGGNARVILCERGIRTFNTGMRYTLDLASVALARRETHLPVIVDPSHGTGEPSLIPAMARAAMAVGADGLLIEVHDDPAEALSDGLQALRPKELSDVVADLGRLAPLLGRRMVRPPG